MLKFEIILKIITKRLDIIIFYAVLYSTLLNKQKHKTMEKEQETINGWYIPKRELTEEEKTRPITFERFQEWHSYAQEDFLENSGSCDHKLFAGWLLHKYPQHFDAICKVMNEAGEYFEINSLLQSEHLDLYDQLDENGRYIEDSSIYKDYAEFVNQTTHLKARDNEVLILLVEYYTKEE